MPQYKLYYFNIPGRAELTRLIFKAAGVDFEDKRLSMEEWVELKSSGKAPFGQMPLLEVDGKILAQSFAIMRYVANEVGLAPSNNLDKAQADMLCDACMDMSMKAIMARFETDEKKKEKLLEEHKAAGPVFLKSFEKLLHSNNGGTGYFVGDKLTYADTTIFDFFDKIYSNGKPLEVPDELKEFPLLAEHYKRVMELPNIKKWLEERPPLPGSA